MNQTDTITEGRDQLRVSLGARIRGMFTGPQAQPLVVVNDQTPDQPTTMTMIHQAEQRGDVDVEAMKALWELHIKVRAEERLDKAERAEEAFNKAMAEFKASDPYLALERSREATVKPRDQSKTGYTYKYQDLGRSLPAFNKALGPFGLHIRYSSQPGDGESPVPAGMVYVRAILAHEQGHKVSVPLMGPPDISGGKKDDPLAAMASAITKLQRYTANLVIGAAAAHDDDGRGGPISEDDIADIRARLKRIGRSERSFCKAFSVASLNAISRQSLIGIDGMLKEAERRADIDEAIQGNKT